MCALLTKRRGHRSKTEQIITLKRRRMLLFSFPCAALFPFSSPIFPFREIGQFQGSGDAWASEKNGKEGGRRENVFMLPPH